MPSDTVVAVLQTWAEAWETHDTSLFAKVIAPDARVVEMPTGRVFVGPDGFSEYLEGTFSGSSGSTFEMKSFAFGNNTLTTEWVWSGVHSSSFMGEEPTGREFAVPGVSVVEVREGLIRRVSDYWDLYTWLRQLGLLPPLDQLRESITQSAEKPG